MSLETLQKDFLKTIAKNKNSEAFFKHIQTRKTLSNEKRWDIYEGSITEGLANTLRETYPACRKLVGEDFFTGMAYRYVAQTPSRSPNLFDYGESFSGFVATFEPAQSLPYLSDVCRLEWAWHQAYYAPNESALDLNALAQVSEAAQDTIVFQLPVSATLIQSIYPIHQIWSMNQEHYQGPPSVDLAEGRNPLIVWRKNGELLIEDISQAQWPVLQSIQKKRHFGSICEDVAQNHPHINMLTLLPELVQRGWIARFTG